MGILMRGRKESGDIIRRKKEVILVHFG